MDGGDPKSEGITWCFSSWFSLKSFSASSRGTVSSADPRLRYSVHRI